MAPIRISRCEMAASCSLPCTRAHRRGGQGSEFVPRLESLTAARACQVNTIGNAKKRPKVPESGNLPHGTRVAHRQLAECGMENAHVRPSLHRPAQRSSASWRARSGRSGRAAASRTRRRQRSRHHVGMDRRHHRHHCRGDAGLRLQQADFEHGQQSAGHQLAEHDRCCAAGSSAAQSSGGLTDPGACGPCARDPCACGTRAADAFAGR
jgi:hypothetical protein